MEQIGRERIIEVLEEVYREDVAGDPEDSFQSFLDDFREVRDPEMPIYWIAETIIGAVERLSGRQFGWYVEALKDEYNFTGEFAFICVEPKTHRCLTAMTDDLGNCSVSVILPITAIDEAVRAVQFFLSLAVEANKGGEM